AAWKQVGKSGKTKSFDYAQEDITGAEGARGDTVGADDVSGVTEQEGAALFPFGPAIAAATMVTLLVGPSALEWYMGLILH
ncbi:MAG: hypothetical protein RRX94_07260, partial [Raoultibacter sp.]